MVKTSQRVKKPTRKFFKVWLIQTYSCKSAETRHNNKANRSGNTETAQRRQMKGNNNAKVSIVETFDISPFNLGVRVITDKFTQCQLCSFIVFHVNKWTDVSQANLSFKRTRTWYNNIHDSFLINISLHSFIRKTNTCMNSNIYRCITCKWLIIFNLYFYFQVLDV